MIRHDVSNPAPLRNEVISSSDVIFNLLVGGHASLSLCACPLRYTGVTEFPNLLSGYSERAPRANLIAIPGGGGCDCRNPVSETSFLDSCAQGLRPIFGLLDKYWIFGLMLFGYQR